MEGHGRYQRQSYIRFVVGNHDDDHRWLTGIITEARLLRDRAGLHPHEVERLEQIYEWFNTNLPRPPFSTSAWPRNTASWFKDSAGPPIEKMWEIVALLKEHSVPVRLLRSKNPGRILYEEDYQVVVEEWQGR